MAGKRQIATFRAHTGDFTRDQEQERTRLLTERVNGMPFAAGRLISITLAAGATMIVGHGLGTQAGWMVVRAYSPTASDRSMLWLDRAVNGASFNTFVETTNNVTLGNRFSVAASRPVLGLRFLYTTATARTLRCKLWDDTAATQLASVDVTVPANATTIGMALFSTPTLVNPAHDYVVSTHETTGTFYCRTPSVDAMQTLSPVGFGGGVILKALNLFATGDARPTSASLSETFWIEPLFAPPGLSEVAITGLDTSKQIALQSLTGGTFDVWFYPYASKVINPVTGIGT